MFFLFVFLLFFGGGGYLDTHISVGLYIKHKSLKMHLSLGVTTIYMSHRERARVCVHVLAKGDNLLTPLRDITEQAA